MITKSIYNLKAYEIKVYYGFHDFEPGDSYTFEQIIEISSLFKKQDIKNMLFAKYKNYRTVVIEINEI